MNKKKISIFSVAMITAFVSGSFIVDKTKSVARAVVVPYHEQWCEEFAHFMKATADFDTHKATLQRRGVDDIMTMLEGGKSDLFTRALSKEQALLVTELKQVIKKIEEVACLLSKYNEKVSKYYELL